MWQGKAAAAYEAFHKSVWNYAWKSPGYYALACISAGRGEYGLALEQVQESLSTNVENLKAVAMQAALQRWMGDVESAEQRIREGLSIDPLDFRILAERFLLTRSDEALADFCVKLGNDVQTLLDVVFDLAWAGLPVDALDLLTTCMKAQSFEHP